MLLLLRLVAHARGTLVDGGGGGVGNSKSVGSVRRTSTGFYVDFFRNRKVGGRRRDDAPGDLGGVEPVHDGGELGLPLAELRLELDDAVALLLAGGGGALPVALAALLAAPGGRLLLGHGDVGLVLVLGLLLLFGVGVAARGRLGVGIFGDLGRTAAGGGGGGGGVGSGSGGRRFNRKVIIIGYLPLLNWPRRSHPRRWVGTVERDHASVGSPTRRLNVAAGSDCGGHGF
mmetsp:Transcript_24928/g.72096  ORF Transcript_24928/g.72096 Transcript_24928/m.72096 type:complete len:230 (-) Transcript_24928:51-740(-)